MRKQAEHLINLVDTAWRIRAFNRALGTNVIDLSVFPVDFVNAVLTWGPRHDAG